MTREDAFYYECLLAIGISDEYDEWLDSSLESESPLSDITLDLVSCRSDVNKTISILYDYRMDQATDESGVCDRLRQFFQKAYHSNRMDKEKVVSFMYSLASHVGDPGDFDLTIWGSIYYFDYYYALVNDGILALEKVDSAFFAYLDDGVSLDPDKLWGTNKQMTFFERLKYWLSRNS